MLYRGYVIHNYDINEEYKFLVGNYYLIGNDMYWVAFDNVSPSTRLQQLVAASAATSCCSSQRLSPQA